MLPEAGGGTRFPRCENPVPQRLWTLHHSQLPTEIPAPKPAPQVLVIEEPSQHVAEYGTAASEGGRVSSPEKSLDRYRQVLSPLKAKLRGQTSRRTIYDVIYSFDEQGNRASSQPAVPSTSGQTVFLGGSFMFGEGLDDDQNLPLQLSLVSGRSVINAGMHGYGSHQAYRLLEEPVTYQDRIGDQAVDLVVCRMISNHANRASGRYSWDWHGPSYQLNGESQLNC